MIAGASTATGGATTAIGGASTVIGDASTAIGDASTATGPPMDCYVVEVARSATEDHISWKLAWVQQGDSDHQWCFPFHC